MRLIIPKLFAGLLCGIICVSEAAAQTASQGKMYNGVEMSKVSFSRDNNPNDHRTTYSITQNGSELYEVNFTYDKDADSIEIVFINRQNFKNNRAKTVKLVRRDSHVIICNYEPNQDFINDRDSLYSILFSIDKPKKQFITLYQFQPLDNQDIQFVLQNIPDSVLIDHRNEVGDFKKNKLKEDQRLFTIKNLKEEMLQYKDSMIKSILDHDAIVMMQGINKEPNALMQGDFKTSMDDLFESSLKTVFPFSNEQYEATFNFSCKGNGKIIIDTVQNINFKTGGQRNWLRTHFIEKIKPRIELEVFKTESEDVTSQGLMEKFHARFEDMITQYSNELSETVTQVRNDLDQYEKKRSIPVPTHYQYTFRYKSELKNPVWRYISENERFVDRSVDSAKVDTAGIFEKFKTKIVNPTKRLYYLQVCLVYLNDQSPVYKDIREESQSN